MLVAFLKLLKLLKLLKKGKKQKSKAMALASLVSFQKQNQDQKHECIRYAHAFLKAKTSKFAPIRDALYLPFKIKRELVIRDETLLKF